MSVSAHRKVVTVLFCDVVGSTALGESVDPEALQGLLARYFERMKGIVESHGGSVEKFIGDAVVAVFGVAVVREVDVLRGCRLAVEMRVAMPRVGCGSWHWLARVASSCRWLATPAWVSHGWLPRRLIRSTLASCGAAVCPTARESPTGR